MNEQAKIASDLRVGIVTFIAILCLVAGITLAGGDRGLLFQKTIPLTARINDISGLKKGSTVTMGGMNIGKVTDITLLDENAENIIEVMMEVRADVKTRIKKDSLPSIRTQGMLGDRYIEISIGSKEAPPLEDGAPLIGSSTSNFDDTLHEARATLTETTKLLEAINKQEGTVGQLVYDETFYQKLTDITVGLNDLIKDFKKNPRRYIKFSIF